MHSPLPGRRLTDKLIEAFHSACDAKDLHAAERHLAMLEILVAQSPPPGLAERRKGRLDLRSARERLAALRTEGRSAAD